MGHPMSEPVSETPMRAKPKTRLAWWFTASARLGHGDGRLVRVGDTHSVKGRLVACQHGLHASAHPMDALCHVWRGSGRRLWIYRVRLSGAIKEHAGMAGARTDKLVSRNRTYLAKAEVTKLFPRSEPLWRNDRQQRARILRLVRRAIEEASSP